MRCSHRGPPPTYECARQPAFGVEVWERTYVYSWSYGVIRRVSAGVNTGLIAYLRGETNAGLGLALEESNPNRTDDDQVEMKETYSVETGSEVGVGLRRNVSVGIVMANLDASVTSEASMRSFGSLQAHFDHPYADADRKAQGIFLALSVLDSVRGSPTQPMVIAMLRTAEVRLPYLDYITAQGAGMGTKVTPLRIGVGADVNLAAQRGGKGQPKGKTVGFTLLDVGVSHLIAAVLTDYGDEYSVGFEDELSVDLTALSPDLPAVETTLVGLLGNVARCIHKEYFFDSATGQLKRIELTLSSEGNPHVFTDVIKKQVAMRITIPGTSLTPSLVEAVGEAYALSDLRTLLRAVPELPYEVTVEDGSSVSVVPALSIPGTPIEIEVGLGLEIESLRNLVHQRGLFLNGRRYVTQVYSADDYVAQPGKNWTDLTTNALEGLWLLVRDAFTWISQQVTSGIGWTLDVIARTTTGILQGTARLIVPAGAHLQRVSAVGGVAIQQTESITVTAIGWIPTSASGTGGLTSRSVVETASGAGFVVGGIYEFQPHTLTVSPAATLIITYTDEAAAGVDENRLGFFRWNPDEKNWQPIAAQADVANNLFMATITQLGSFALGYDDSLPQVDILAPINGGTVTNTLPLISALVMDTGVGINPMTVQMGLDGQVVAAKYISETGELLYLPSAPLTNGPHTVTVSASDMVGNVDSALSSFTVESCVAAVGDFDCSCSVDAQDVQSIAARWHLRGPEYDPHFDTDLDGDIDIADVQQVATTWGAYCEFQMPPAAPSDLVATARGQSEVDLTWTDNSNDETEFRIERSPDGTTSWNQVVTVPADVASYNDTGLECNTAHYYRIRAYRSSDGQFSGYSNVANATTDACLPPGWYTKASIPTARADLAAVAYSGRIWAIGGRNGSGALTTVEIYDPGSDTWTTGPSLPTAKAYAGAVVIDGKLYVLGDDNLVYVYDEVNNEWDARALMPVQAGNLALGVVNGILYVTHDQNWMYAYNPTSDTWSPRMPIHITRSIESFAALNGKLYAIGGGEPGHVPSEIDRIDVYDPAMDSWTIGALASLSVRRTHLGATTPVIDNRIYVIGGWNGYSQQSGVEIYNPHTNTWVAGPSMPTARYALACAALGHIIYCLGGDRGGMGGNWQSANEASVVESAPSP